MMSVLKPIPIPVPALNHKPRESACYLASLVRPPTPPPSNLFRGPNHRSNPSLLIPEFLEAVAKSTNYHCSGCFSNEFGVPFLVSSTYLTWLGIESLILGFNSRNFSTSRERRQFTKRAVISIGLTKLLSSYITSIIKFDNLDSLPTRPSEEDIGLISQLPELITLFGRRIKLIQRNSDQYLVIYRKSAKSPKLPIDDDLRKESSLGVKTSLISWMVLSNFLKTIDLINDHQPTNASIITIQKIFNDRSSHSEQLYQILEAFRLDPSSLDDEARQDLKSFLVEERLFREDWVHHGNRVSKAKKGYKNFLHKAVHDGEYFFSIISCQVSGREIKDRT